MSAESAQFLPTICLHIMLTGDVNRTNLMRTQLMADCRHFLLESADSRLKNCTDIGYLGTFRVLRIESYSIAGI